MEESLKTCMSSLELMSELVQVVESNGGTNDFSVWCGSRLERVASVSEILLPLFSVKDVSVSINSEWWEWQGQKPLQPRYKGKMVNG